MREIELQVGSHPRTVLGASLDLAVDHFRSRPPDLFLRNRAALLCHNGNAAKGKALKSGQIKFANFPSTKLALRPTWSEDPFDDRAWQWNLHSLVVLRFLLAAYSKTAELWYLTRAEQLILDWAEDNFTPDPPSEFSWSDHSTALRLENVLYFLECARCSSISSTAIGSALGVIWSHAAVLSDPSFYKRRTNHGLDQSYALYLAGAVFPEFVDAANWREIGKRRILDELSFAFTSEGVHVENSPSYHLMMLNRAIHVEATLRHYEGAIQESPLTRLLDGAFRFAAYLIRPDGALPIIGDSQAERVGDDSIYKVASGLRSYEEFRYAVTQGREGAPPEELMRVFPQSGYAIIRDNSNSADFSDSCHVVFKAGFLSAYHKHDDDLSFVLYRGGEDWIIDAGTYRYQEQDPYRRYVRSAAAHNVVLIDAVVSRREWKDVGGSRIDGFETSGPVVYVRGSHELFPGVTARRELTYRPDVLRITDSLDVDDEGEHVFRAFFHVPSDKSVTLSGRQVVVVSQTTGRKMCLVPVVGAFENVSIVSGKKAPDPQGWISTSYGQLDEAHCIILEGRGRCWRSVVELRFDSRQYDSVVGAKAQVEDDLCQSLGSANLQEEAE
jgi:hypothetical protein